jgi:hypothetical protein
LETVRVLLEHGADPRARGGNILREAELLRDPAILEALRQALGD